MSNVQKIDAIIVCGGCHCIFSGRDMAAICPDCGGMMKQGLTSSAILSALADSDVMDMALQDDDLGDRIIEVAAKNGYIFDPFLCGEHRLTKQKTDAKS